MAAAPVGVLWLVCGFARGAVGSGRQRDQGRAARDEGRAVSIGIVGNVILFFVYIGITMGVDDKAPLFGQSARQIFFIITSLYGWWRWRQVKREQHTGDAHAITPRWASWGERAGLVVTMVLGVAVAQQVFTMLGAGWPAPRWYHVADAWIFMGSLLATLGMAKGWVEFWLIWVAVDLVGVPLLWSAGYYASAFMYLFYGAFTLTGFFVWWRVRSRRDAEPDRVTVETAHLDPTVRRG